MATRVAPEATAVTVPVANSAPRGPSTRARALRALRVLRGGADVGHLAEEPGDDEHHLLGDLDRVVADALQAARHEDHEHPPLAQLQVVADLDGALEDLAVEPVDLRILAHEILS